MVSWMGPRSPHVMVRDRHVVILAATITCRRSSARELAVSTWGVGLDPYILEVRDIGVALGPVEPPLSRHMWTYQVHETSVIVPEHDTRPLHRHSARGVLTVSLNPSP